MMETIVCGLGKNFIFYGWTECSNYILNRSTWPKCRSSSTFPPLVFCLCDIHHQSCLCTDCRVQQCVPFLGTSKGWVWWGQWQRSVCHGGWLPLFFSAPNTCAADATGSPFSGTCFPLYSCWVGRESAFAWFWEDNHWGLTSSLFSVSTLPLEEPCQFWDSQSPWNLWWAPSLGLLVVCIVTNQVLFPHFRKVWKFPSFSQFAKS